jgi:hypothetical protein
MCSPSVGRATSVDCSWDSVVVLQGIHVFFRQACACDFISDGDPVVMQIVLPPEDLQEAPCHPCDQISARHPLRTACTNSQQGHADWVLVLRLVSHKLRRFPSCSCVMCPSSIPIIRHRHKHHHYNRTPKAMPGVILPRSLQCHQASLLTRAP